MTKRAPLCTWLWWIVLSSSIAAAQEAAPGTSPATPTPKPEETSRQQNTDLDGLSPAELPGGKVGLVRGVVKRTDPVHDQLIIHAFGGGDVRVAFDPRTHLLPDNSGLHLTSIPVGSVVSVDTVIENGRLFARSIRTGRPRGGAVELSGKVVRYDAAQSRLILRDPISPEDVSLRITPSTAVVNQGKPESPQALSPGMLVRVSFSATNDAASNIAILARPGDSFAFVGKVLSVDLRSRVVSLSSSTDQTVRELVIGSLDPNSLALLREGADLNIQAQFDGDQYNIRSVRAITPSP